MPSRGTARSSATWRLAVGKPNEAPRPAPFYNHPFEREVAAEQLSNVGYVSLGERFADGRASNSPALIVQKWPHDGQREAHLLPQRG